MKLTSKRIPNVWDSSDVFTWKATQQDPMSTRRRNRRRNRAARASRKKNQS